MTFWKSWRAVKLSKLIKALLISGFLLSGCNRVATPTEVNAGFDNGDYASVTLYIANHYVVVNH